jgi:Tol biopolymer transport system component
VWSPDGTHLLVRRGDHHSNDLWILDLEGNLVQQVTHQPASYDIYAWAP